MATNQKPEAKGSPMDPEYGCLGGAAGKEPGYAWIKVRSTFGSKTRVAKFKAMITNFSDSFNSSWNEESVFARMDPIATFQRTSRKINLTFKVVSSGEHDAEFNLGQVERLINFMYPVWSSDAINPSPMAAPLVDIKFSTLIAAKSSWLSGYIGNLNVDHDMEAGFLFVGAKQHLMIPKEITISFDFTVLHETILGTARSGKKSSFIAKQFPYGARSGLKRGTWDVNGADPDDVDLGGVDDAEAAAFQAGINKVFDARMKRDKNRAGRGMEGAALVMSDDDPRHAARVQKAEQARAQTRGEAASDAMAKTHTYDEKSEKWVKNKKPKRKKTKRKPKKKG